jgi:hypothetical protein
LCLKEGLLIEEDEIYVYSQRLRDECERMRSVRDELSAVRAEAGRKGGLQSGKVRQNEAKRSKTKQGLANEAEEIRRDKIRRDKINNTKNKSNFVKPSLNDLKNHIKAKGYLVDPESFLAFYESNGWRVGKNPMKSWQSALVTWHKRKKEERKNGRKADFSVG